MLKIWLKVNFRWLQFCRFLIVDIKFKMCFDLWFEKLFSLFMNDAWIENTWLISIYSQVFVNLTLSLLGYFKTRIHWGGVNLTGCLQIICKNFFAKLVQSVFLCHRLPKKLKVIKIWQLKVGQNKDLVCYWKKRYSGSVPDDSGG